MEHPENSQTPAGPHTKQLSVQTRMKPAILGWNSIISQPQIHYSGNNNKAPFGGFHKWGYPPVLIRLNGSFQSSSILGYPHDGTPHPRAGRALLRRPRSSLASRSVPPGRSRMATWRLISCSQRLTKGALEVLGENGLWKGFRMYYS